MKYFAGFIIAMALSIQFVNAQQMSGNSDSVALKSFIKLTASWYNGLEWEKRIGRTSVIDLFGGILAGIATDDFLDYNAPIIIVPDTYAEFRNYYNLFRRISNQKKTANNSANFLFGRVEVIFPVKNQNYINLMFIQGWGAQRSLGKKINAECHFGLIEHFYYDKPPDGGFNYLKFQPHGQCTISYLF